MFVTESVRAADRKIDCIIRGRFFYKGCIFHRPQSCAFFYAIEHKHREKLSDLLGSKHGTWTVDIYIYKYICVYIFIYVYIDGQQLSMKLKQSYFSSFFIYIHIYVCMCIYMCIYKIKISAEAE